MTAHQLAYRFQLVLMVSGSLALMGMVVWIQIIGQLPSVAQ